MLSLDLNQWFGWFQNKIRTFPTKCRANSQAVCSFVVLLLAFSLVTCIELIVFLLETLKISVTSLNREAEKFVC
jgi:hypothetical protein